MTRRMKRLLMATVMCLAVLANVAVATAETFRVMNETFTKGTSKSILNETVRYDGQETLILDGVNLDTGHPFNILEIPDTMDLTIALEGTNTIKHIYAECIHAGRNLTISGDSDSSLTIDSYQGAENGIVVQGAVTIEGKNPGENGPTVTVKVEPTASTRFYGIQADSLTVTDGSTLDASVTDASSSKKEVGAAISVNTMAVKEGATVLATAGSKEHNNNVLYNGLEVKSKLTINNATVKAEATSGIPSGIKTDGTIEISGNSELTVKGGLSTNTGGTATFIVSPTNGAIAEVKVGNSADGTDAELLGSYNTKATFSGDSWTKIAQNLYFFTSITGGSPETPPGGGTEGTPEGGTGVPLPEDEIPIIYPPKTGDNTPILFYLGALLVSGTGIVLITVYTRKRREGQ